MLFEILKCCKKSFVLLLSHADKHITSNANKPADFACRVVVVHMQSSTRAHKIARFADCALSALFCKHAFVIYRTNFIFAPKFLITKMLGIFMIAIPLLRANLIPLAITPGGDCRPVLFAIACIAR